MRPPWRACAAALALLAVPAAADPAPDNRDPRLNPAQGEGTPAYKGTLDERDLQRRQESLDTGRSHVDVLTPAAAGGEGEAAKPPEVGVKAEVPERTEEAVTPERARPRPGVQPVRRVSEEAPPAPGRDADVEAAGLHAFIAALVEALDRKPDVRRIAYSRGEGREPAAPAAPAAGPPVRTLPAVGAGDAFYARLLHAVNSDYPGPVLVEILQQPLAGAVARGAFQLVRNRMVIRLSSLDFGGEALAVDAIAVGLDCACFGVAGDVSYHWWERVLLPAASGFVERYLIARAEPERRVVAGAGGAVIEDRRARTARQARDEGLAAAAGRVGQVLLEQAPAVRTVRIPRNAELAVMFAGRLERGRVRPAEPEPGPRRPAPPPPVERVEAPAAERGEVR